MNYTVRINDIEIGKGRPLVLISGPCVIEDFETTYEIAAELKDLTDRLAVPFIFKSSYDKANRTSIQSYRGPGIVEGLEILSRIKDKLNVPVISDVHGIHEVEPASRVLDVIQIPAFLCRQTDLILEAAKTKKTINIKKGQFLAPWDMANVVAKAVSAGNERILITERGAMFGYNNLVSDFRSISIMQRTGWPVIFDATHSVQLPGGSPGCSVVGVGDSGSSGDEGQSATEKAPSSGGEREFAPILARAAVAAGADGVFLEVHKDPDKALCDGPNSLKLTDLPALLMQLIEIKKIVD